jgi:ribosomal-protein-alanine N-acetyltransferase
MVVPEDLVTTGGPVGAAVVAPMRRRHLRGVLAIEHDANPRPWSHRLFAGELRMPTSRLYLVALQDHEVVGYAGLMTTLDEGHITNIAVHSDHRRRHLATMLMLVMMRRAVERGVVDMTLEVRMSNVAAKEMYRRFGFAPGGVRKGYYQESGEDALIMWAHGIDSTDQAERLEALAAALPLPFVDRTEGVDPLADARDDADDSLADSDYNDNDDLTETETD